MHKTTTKFLRRTYLKCFPRATRSHQRTIFNLKYFLFNKLHRYFRLYLSDVPLYSGFSFQAKQLWVAVIGNICKDHKPALINHVTSEEVSFQAKEAFIFDNTQNYIVKLFRL